MGTYFSKVDGGGREGPFGLSEEGGGEGEGGGGGGVHEGGWRGGEGGCDLVVCQEGGLEVRDCLAH